MESGKQVLGAGKTAEWGYPAFGGWAVNAAVAAENVVAFAGAIDAAHLENPSAWIAVCEPVAAIAQQTGADPVQFPDRLANSLSMRGDGAADDDTPFTRTGIAETATN